MRRSEKKVAKLEKRKAALEREIASLAAEVVPAALQGRTKGARARNHEAALMKANKHGERVRKANVELRRVTEELRPHQQSEWLVLSERERALEAERIALVRQMEAIPKRKRSEAWRPGDERRDHKVFKRHKEIRDELASVQRKLARLPQDFALQPSPPPPVAVAPEDAELAARLAAKREERYLASEESAAEAARQLDQAMKALDQRAEFVAKVLLLAGEFAREGTYPLTKGSRDRLTRTGQIVRGRKSLRESIASELAGSSLGAAGIIGRSLYTPDSSLRAILREWGEEYPDGMLDYGVRLVHPAPAHPHHSDVQKVQVVDEFGFPKH